jgi:hypothetical protein
VNRGVAAPLSVTLFLASAWSLGAWHGATIASPPRRVAVELGRPAAAPTGDSGWSSLPVPLLEGPAPEGRPDLYGNDITDAVANYKSDRTGGVYEEHSPQTELPKLTPPTT